MSIQINHKSSGYILVFTLMIISISVIIVFQVFDKGTVHDFFIKNIVEREHAQSISLGGVQLALSQLTDHETPAKGASAGALPEQKKQQDQLAKEKKLLETLLPVINRWQIIPLQEKTEGIDAQLKICVMSENGKININEWFDFKEHKFVGEGSAQGDAKKAFQLIFSTIKKSMGEPNLFESFEKFLKQRHYRVNDATELLAIKEFEIFKDAVFYDPPASGKEKKEARKKMYLTDIFTTWPTTRGIEPWLFSDSVAGLFSLKQADEGTIEEREQSTKEWLKQFKPTAQWAQDWKTMLLPVHGKDFKNIPQELAFMLSTKFEPTMFSVLSYATVGNATHKICAIIERYKQPDKDAYNARVRKIYWL
jgi:hypothetical protein